MLSLAILRRTGLRKPASAPLLKDSRSSLKRATLKHYLMQTLSLTSWPARPELVAAELTRVCRSGGMIAMANWTPAGFVGQMFKTISRHIAPSGMPAPVLWGDE